MTTNSKNTTMADDAPDEVRAASDALWDHARKHGKHPESQAERQKRADLYDKFCKVHDESEAKL